MQTSGNERRKRTRSKSGGKSDLKLRYLDGKGTAHFTPAVLVDCHEDGCGIEIGVSLLAGVSVMLIGDWFRAGSARQSTVREGAVGARVAWCLYLQESNRYRAGVRFLEPVEWTGEHSSRASGEELPQDFVDYYEVMQLSPNAEMDTIQRVYRLLAQRLHPDNQETGDTAQFRKLLEAYQVLSDPERRAAFDNGHEHRKRRRWRMFDQSRASRGVEMEKVKRQGILALLYTKRVNVPEDPGMTIMEIEDLLGLPREHLSFSLWYLREGEFVQRTDRGYFSITARGVDEAEKSNCWLRQEVPLLPERNEKEAPAA